MKTSICVTLSHPAARLLPIMILTTLVATSAQAATVINIVDSAGNVGQSNSLVLDSSGFPVISYYDSTNGDVKLAHCNDPNCAGGDESIVTVDSDGDVGLITSLILDSSGFPVVSYYDATNGNVKLAHCNDPNCAGGDESIVTVASGASNSLDLDAGGYPVISVGSVSNGLFLVHCNDVNCAGGDESIEMVESVPSSDQSLALDDSGIPVISFWDVGTLDLKLAHCNDANCAGGDESIVTIDADGVVGASSSLALDSSGYPVVSYQDITNSDLKLVHCNDPNCSGGDESIAALDDIGAYSSLALDSAGFPVVSHYDGSLGLKLVHCNDPNCTGGDESISTVDEREGLGGYTSLALDAAGYPVISYYDWIEEDLKLAHCDDPNCPAGPFVIRVPEDFPTIQAAIDAASDGDTVLVAAGTYVENINFLGKDITVTSESGPDVTIIDGNRADSVVTFISAETWDAVLSGFTLRNGRSGFDTPGFGDGGGVRISSSSPTVEGNVIEDNQACVGAGISVDSGQPRIRENVIRANSQAGCSGGVGGGGISLQGSSPAQILDNVISDNVMISADGGGISLWAAGSPTIIGNLIVRNVATGLTPCAKGGGISLANSSDALIVGNLIAGNSAGCGGGVSWLVPSGQRGPLLVNNTIVWNNSELGSGIFADGFDAQAQLANNIIVGRVGQTAVYCGDFNDLNEPIFRFNDIFTPNGEAYGGICTDHTGMDGNISADPKFKSIPARDFHLGAGSPCIDAGDNSASEPYLQLDIDSDLRILDGDGDGSAVVDMGIDEFAARTFIARLTGEQEVPPVETVASGRAGLEAGRFGLAIRYILRLRDIGEATSGHIHCAAVGSNGPVGVTLFSDASYSGTMTLRGSIREPDADNQCGWITLQDVLVALRSGDTYVNIHSAAYPAGEIRGQLKMPP